MNKKHLFASVALSAFMLIGAGANFFISKSNSRAIQAEAISDVSRVTKGLAGDPINTDPVAQEYYKNISTTSTKEDLIDELYALIHPAKCSTAYSSIWNYLPYCDAYNPDSSSDDQIIAFYRGTGGSRSAMNKEHVWPKSRGGASIEGDPHMVRPTFNNDNSSRGNDFYNLSPTSYDPNEFGADQYRGICARIIFYCAVQEKNHLTLVDKTTDSTVDTKNGTMGKLSTLLQWNLDYPIDPTEILRNQVLSGQRSVRGKSWDFNRNPFIDDRSYACRIWGDTNETTREICKASASVAPTSITLNKSSASIQQEATVQLSVASVTPSDASSVVTWVSSNSNVATVSTSGLVTGKSVGSATITAKSALDASVTAGCTITVTEPTPVNLTSISATASGSSIYVGKTTTISVSTTPSYVYPAPTYSYSSNDTSVATVSNNGVISGVGEGNATITVTATQGSIVKTDTVSISVIEAPASTDYTIGWGDATGTAGTYTNFTTTSGSATDILSYTTKKNSGTNDPAYNANSKELRLYYSSTGNGCSITITPAEGVTFTKAVMTTSTNPSVKYSVDGGSLTSVPCSNNTYTMSNIDVTTSLTIQNANTTNTQLRIKTITLTCSSAALTPSLSLDKSLASVEEGGHVTLTATAEHGSGDVTWSSDNTGVATVSPSSGSSITVNALSEGSATITASYSGVTASCVVTVTSTPEPSSSGMKEAYLAAAALSVGQATTKEYTFTGIVTGTVGKSFYVQDGNYGMYVYKKEVANIAIGKEITVTSTLQNYKGILETKTVSSATLTGNTGFISPASVTSYDHLQSFNQSILTDLSSARVISKDSTSTPSSSCDFKISVNIGGNNITIFGSKDLPNIASFAAIYSQLASGDFISLDDAVTSYVEGKIQLSLTEQSKFTIGYTLDAFCEEFLNNMYCSSSGATAPTFAVGFSWAEFETLYGALSDSDQEALTVATANEYGDELKEQVVARYDYVVGKYHYTNFMNRTINYSQSNMLYNLFNINTNVAIIFIASFSAIAISLVIVLLVCNKKKHY